MKFLLIQFYQIGDVVLTTHIPRTIKTYFPASQIDFLTYQVNESLLIHNPHISNVIPFRKQDGTLTFVKLLKTIRNARYDVVLDFQDTPRSTYTVAFSGAPNRVTYEGSSRSIFYNILPTAGKGWYPTLFKSNLLKPFIDNLNMNRSMPPKPEIYFSEKESLGVQALLQECGISEQDFIVTMAPTHRRETKRWPLRHFYDTARYLMDRYDAKVILSWAPGEQDYIRAHEGFGSFWTPQSVSGLQHHSSPIGGSDAKGKNAHRQRFSSNAYCHLSGAADVYSFRIHQHGLELPRKKAPCRVQPSELPPLPQAKLPIRRGNALPRRPDFCRYQGSTRRIYPTGDFSLEWKGDTGRCHEVHP
jgi:hypothetical protein